MNQPIPPTAPMRDVLHLLRTYPLRWLLPTIAIAVAVAMYAVAQPHDVGGIASIDGPR